LNIKDKQERENKKIFFSINRNIFDGVKAMFCSN